jgi:hypothetical protein
MKSDGWDCMDSQPLPRLQLRLAPWRLDAAKTFPRSDITGLLLEFGIATTKVVFKATVSISIN